MDEQEIREKWERLSDSQKCNYNGYCDFVEWEKRGERLREIQNA